MATKERESLSKDTFIELVQDRGGWQGFLYALYQKLVSVAERLDHLTARVTDLEGDEITSGTVDAWVADAAAKDPGDADEQMLGDRSPYGWHLLHPECWSWDEVRRLRAEIVEDVKAQGIFKTPGHQVINSVTDAIHRGKAFESYRRFVWEQTGDPEARPAVAGLDPLSYLGGLQELASEADEPAKYRNRFIEIHVKGTR
jgi:hypothetical protein